MSPRSSIRALLPEERQTVESLAHSRTTEGAGWIESRVRELSQIFAIAVVGFSVMDNQLDVLLRLDPDVAYGWSDEQVVRRFRVLNYSFRNLIGHTPGGPHCRMNIRGREEIRHGQCSQGCRRTTDSARFW